MPSWKPYVASTTLALLAVSLCCSAEAVAQTPSDTSPPPSPPTVAGPTDASDGDDDPEAGDPDELPPLVPSDAKPTNPPPDGTPPDAPPTGPPPNAPPAYSGYPPPGYGPPPARGGAYPPHGYGYPPAPYPYGMAYLPPPRTLPYHEGEPAPDGYQLDTRARKGFIIAGAITFGSSYLLSSAAALALQDGGDAEEFSPLFVPLVGPFITVGTADPSALGTFGLIADGLAQSTGLALFITGFASEQKIWVRKPAAYVKLTPIVGGSRFSGLGLTGEM